MRNWQTIIPIVPEEWSNPYWFMTIDQFQIGINELVANGLILPHGINPASYPGGTVEAVCTSWARWRKYGWNPPEFMTVTDELLQEFGDTDWDASPKPSWQDIRKAYETSVPKLRRIELAKEIREETQRRIIIVYGADDLNDEILIRLRGEESAYQNAERDRLRAKGSALRASLDGLSLDTLKDYNPGDDSLWTPISGNG